MAMMREAVVVVNLMVRTLLEVALCVGGGEGNRGNRGEVGDRDRGM